MNENHVASIKYNDKQNELTVTYQGGSTVTYHPVQAENYAELVKANCLDRAINKLIRVPHIVGITQLRGH